MANDEETKPLLGPGGDMGAEQPRWAKNLRGTASFLALACVYIMVSSSMIVTNKYVVHKDRFPFPVVLVLIHIAFCSVVSFLLYKVMPSLFPSFSDPLQAVRFHDTEVLKRVMALAFLFTSALVMNNSALLFSDVASLQMIKESIVVMVYFWSVLFSVERFGFGQLGIVVCVAATTAMATNGELHFSLPGVILQLLSMVCESGRTVLQSTVLSGSGSVKFDPLSYLMVVSPIAIVYLVVAVVIGHHVMHIQAFAMPSFVDLHRHWAVLLGNALLAFALNVLLAFMLRLASPVSVVFCGIARDVLIVFGARFIFKEGISTEQSVAFSCQIILIALWSSTKLYPSAFSSWIKHGPPSSRKEAMAALASSSSQDADKAV